MTSSLDILLTGHASGKLSSEQCWDEITKANLWPDQEVLLLTVHLGRDTARTMAGLRRAHPSVYAGLVPFLRASEGNGLIDYDSRRFIERLFEGV